MIFHLTQFLQDYLSIFNLFKYVSVRVIAALLSSLFLSFLFGDWFIKTSRKNFRSKIREFVPGTHLKKNNTPTMGGLLIIMIFLINMLLWCNLKKANVWIFALCLISFGLIGFLDDYKKIKFHKGISARLKFNLQIFSSLIIVSLWYFLSNPPTNLCIPFLKNFSPHLGWLLIPWGAFVIIATSNAVNLTDGLDGLATGPLIFNYSTFSVIAYLAGHKYFAGYLFIPFTNTAELTILGATLVGSLLGFLWYNAYPAQIFMGDVGALALGAGLALMSLMVRQELLLIIAGGIFVIETLSVIVQVFSFKMFGKRVFKMAPIHHHFELLGWNEVKITVRFWIISIVLALITLLTLKIR
ncbi:MAG: phospho-N-acetylmuramoyl-pentapeptide-transferase [bacterium]